MTVNRVKPTDSGLRRDSSRLLTEVAVAMAGDRWAILPTATDNLKHKVYDGASLRHCCLLLAEIEQAAKQRLEMAVRILGRAHIEAWLFGIYLHFGGYPSLERIGQDTLEGIVKVDAEAKAFDSRIKQDRRKAKKRVARVRKTNAEIERWNIDNRDKQQKPTHDEPYIPKRHESGIDLSGRIGASPVRQPADLPVSVFVDELTKLAPELGFGRESFRPLYLIYRLVSAAGPHPTLDLYEGYLRRGGFIRIASEPDGQSLIYPTRVSALYLTGFLAEWVLRRPAVRLPSPQRSGRGTSRIRTARQVGQTEAEATSRPCLPRFPLLPPSCPPPAVWRGRWGRPAARPGPASWSAPAVSFVPGRGPFVRGFRAVACASPSFPR